MFIRTVAKSKTQPCITFVETRSGVVLSFVCARKGGYEDLTKKILRHFEAYGYLNPVIIQCDKEMSIIDVCGKVARERNARNSVKICAKNKSSEQRVCRSSVRTHSGTRTMLPDKNPDEFSNFTCHSILQFVTLDLCCQDSQCDPTAEPHSNICSELHMYHFCASYETKDRAIQEYLETPSKYSILVQFEARSRERPPIFTRHGHMQSFSTTHCLQLALRKRYV